MKISIHKPHAGIGALQRESEALANIMATALQQRHAAEPFTNSLQLSEWLHREYPNPRVRIQTAENGSPVEVTEKASGWALLTITCHPTH